MAGPLYGRAVEPKLIRQLLVRPEDGSCPQPPTLVLEGGTATGKTALLGEIARGWMGKVPYSYLDVAAVEEELGEQAIPETLAVIASQLARRCRLYGSLRFDRLVIGLQAMRLDLSDVDPELARTQVAAMLNERRGLGTLKRVLGDFAQEALKLVPSPIGTPTRVVVELAIGASVDGLAGWLLSRNALGRAKSWYGHQDRGLALDPIGQLVDLNWARRHPARADARSQVDELLCDAFLADLRDNFRCGRRSDEWTLNCLVLFDNVDCGLGQTFLRQLVALRDPADGADVDPPSPLVVVGGSRGSLIAGMAQVERATVVELTSTRDLIRPKGQQPAWGRRRLPPLSLDDVRKMSTTALAAYRQNNLAGMLHHLTGGHPGGLAFLLKVITDVRPDGVEPEALLALPYGDHTVGETLTARLLAGVAEDDLDVLVTCSAARDRREGLRLLGRAVDRGTAAVMLPVGMWDPAGEVPTTLLRTLLLRRLARRSEDPWDWARTHTVLRAAVGPSGEPDPAGELHHMLAMGEIKPVLDALAGRLGAEPLPAWLRLIQTVATAPAQSERPDPPTGDWPSFLPPLLTRLWKTSDPLLGSDRSGLYARVAGGLNDLATHRDDTCDELLDLVAHYQNLARQWRRGAR